MNVGGASSSPMVVPAYGGAGGGVQPPPFWSTPTPYLFIGFAIVMSLIAVALAELLCSRRKEGQSREEDQEVIAQAGMMSVRVLAPLDRESPKVIVVMAGDDAPSFLASATPLAFTRKAAKTQQTYCQCHNGGAKVDAGDARVDAAAM
jgi:hypothetical protein